MKTILELLNDISNSNEWLTFESFKDHITVRWWTKEKDPKEFKMNFLQTHIIEEREPMRTVWHVMRVQKEEAIELVYNLIDNK